VLGAYHRGGLRLDGKGETARTQTWRQCASSPVLKREAYSDIGAPRYYIKDSSLTRGERYQGRSCVKYAVASAAVSKDRAATQSLYIRT